MAFHSQIAGSQIDGARDYQEDAFLITHLDDKDSSPSTLLIVADGMGGHAAGNVASNMAVQAFNKYISAHYLAGNISDILSAALSKANGSLTDTIKETAALHGMGCTMVSAMIQDNKLWWVSVGDSHLYLLRDRQLIKLNEDHSYGGFLDRMEAAGTPIKPEKGLSRNMLMSALTGDDIAEIDCPLTPFILQHDDRLLICSDGMDSLSSGKIIQYTSWADTPKECSRALLDAVEEEGIPKQDNTTVVVVIMVDETVDKPIEVEVDFVDEEDITQPESAKQKPIKPSISPPVYDTGKKSRWVVFAIIFFVLVGLGIGGYLFINSSTIKQLTTSINSLTNSAKSLLDKSTEKVTTTVENITKQPPEEATPVAPQPTEQVTTATPVAPQPTEQVTTATPVAPQPTEQVTTATPTTTPQPTAQVTAAKQSAVLPPKVETPKKAVLTSGNEFQDTLESAGKGPAMIIVPSGSFQMGSPASSRFAEERPRHEVSIQSFAVSKYEITYAEYEQFTKATNRTIPKGNAKTRRDYPIFNVSWDDAYNYAKWLSAKTKKKYHLLSESEWEYMASTGKRSAFWWGHEHSIGKAHCFGCESGLDPRYPGKVGSFEPNEFGIHDTAGNIGEWVRDCWHDNYNGASTDNSVWEGGDCEYRVIRGGSYSNPQQSLRSAKRDKLRANGQYDHVGIRVARDLD